MSNHSGRDFRVFQFRDAVYHVHSDHPQVIIRRLRKLWNELEQFIACYPRYAEALGPIQGLIGIEQGHVPESVRRMALASESTGVGPMAAVAGTFAQIAAEAGQSEGDEETIIENGGDVYMYIRHPLNLGLWVGPHSPFRDLAFSIGPEHSPLAVCSSSSFLGHSMSFGKCDLATVFSKNASCADAAATACCNQIQTSDDLHTAVETVVGIYDIDGVLAIKDDKIAIAGATPELVRHTDAELDFKISRHSRSEFSS